MKEDKLAPKRRFKEFENDGAWEQCKLGEVLKTESFRPYLKEPEADGKYKIIQQGDNPLVGYANGEPYCDYEKIVLFGDHTLSLYKPKSPFFISTDGVKLLYGTNNLYGNFLLYLLENYKPKTEGYKRYYSILKDQYGYLPSNINEQQKIGVFFMKLDNLITLHQRKLKKLKETKSAYLSEMFPKEGAAYPKLRFDGFTDPWEQRKLKEVAEIAGGGTPSTVNPEYWDGAIDWYSPTEIGNHIYAKGSIKKITKLGLEKSSAKILPEDRTVLFTSRAGIGDMAILQHPGATNQGFQSFVLKEGIDTYFIYSMGHLIKKYALKNASGSTFLEISGKTLGDMPILMPSTNEQTQIGTFFKSVDNLITLHQRKLEKLENLKKAYLNEMFV